VTLALVGTGSLVVAARAGGELTLGPSSIEIPAIDAGVLLTALTVLVVPQAPLTFANSCLATADAARTYFHDRARQVRPGRLATTLGLANLFSGTVAGMPVCHGAGGMTAHYAFGARTAGAPLFMGMVLIALALGAGSGLALVLAAFPLPILAGLLGAAGLLHIGLLRDLEDAPSWALALLVGAVGFLLNLAVALAIGLVAWWLVRGALRLRATRAARAV
jgi:SulP family sulfate permease